MRQKDLSNFGGQYEKKSYKLSMSDALKVFITLAIIFGSKYTFDF